MDELLLWNCMSALLIFGVALGGAFLPKYLQQKGENDSTISKERYDNAFKLGNIFSGGVMLSAGLVHLLGDAIIIPKHKTADYNFDNIQFPIAPFLTALGCMVTLSMDAIVDIVKENRKNVRDDKQQLLTEVGNLFDDLEKRTMNGVAENESKKPVGGSAATHERTHEHDHLVSQGKLVYRGMEMVGTTQQKSENGQQKQNCEEEGCREHSSNGMHSSIHVHNHQHGHHVDGELHPHTHTHAHVHGEIPEDVSFLTGLVLTAALSVHSILEGAALGAQQNLSQLRDIFIAIIAHKGMAAYALGAALLESKPTNVKFWTPISTFCLASPIGIFVGYGLSGLSGKAGLALSALASGTFLYVALMEVIPKELSEPKLKGWKMVCLWVGFGFMSLLAIWA